MIAEGRLGLKSGGGFLSIDPQRAPDLVAYRNHAYGRLELVDKTSLGLTGAHDHGIHRVTALTVGGVRDIDSSDAFDLGLGADATVYSLDAETRAVYGDNPFSFRVYLRLRPPTMAH